MLFLCISGAIFLSKIIVRIERTEMYFICLRAYAHYRCFLVIFHDSSIVCISKHFTQRKFELHF
ncbi:MAG: hypothetical protein Greene101415_1147 [Parcubacteria group bacterium Greene1014_15]|nr:MAG: hypothetical protein Greene101415_1147 [Parcubacteria group bacterium Greene1014_15]